MTPNPSDALQAALRRILGEPETPPPMSELVARLDAWLSRNRPHFHTHLVPGLTAEELTRFESQLGVTLPNTFRTLYLWRNGHCDTNTACFHGNREWLSADDIARIKQALDSMIGYDFAPGWWERSWVPFLHNGGGSYLCVDVVGLNGGTPGQLVEFWKADADRPVVSPSLESWLHQFVRSLERDRWAETEYGFECVERHEQHE